MTRKEVFELARVSGLKVVDYDGEDRFIELEGATFWQKPPFTQLAGRMMVFMPVFGKDGPLPCRLERCVVKIPTDDEPPVGAQPIYLGWYVPVPSNYDLVEKQSSERAEGGADA